MPMGLRLIDDDDDDDEKTNIRQANSLMYVIDIGVQIKSQLFPNVFHFQTNII